MSEYSVRLTGLQSESENLTAASQAERSCSEELIQIIRALQTQTCFDSQILRLRQISGTLEQQCAALQKLSSTLNSIADCYRTYENRAVNTMESSLAAGDRILASASKGTGTAGAVASTTTGFHTGSNTATPYGTPVPASGSWWQGTTGEQFRVGIQSMLALVIVDMFNGGFQL